MQLKKNQRDDRYADLTSAYNENDQQQGTEFPATSNQRPAARREAEGEAEASQAPRPAAPARGESVIDDESNFDGKYETGQDLRILGTVSGEILCRGMLTVERDASAKAKIRTQDLVVRGRVEGDIVCSGRLLITSSGVITGTMKAATLVVEEGATLRGTVETAASDDLEAPAPPPAKMTRKEREEAAANSNSDDSSEESSSTGTTGRSASGRWNRASREVPSFALVSSEERASAPLDRN